MDETTIFDHWRQDAPWLNEAEAWPKALFPDAEYHAFRECGCLVCALAVMLKSSGIENASEEAVFNPWVLNQRLIACGAFTPAADLELENVRKLYPLEYLGSAPYSREALERFVAAGSCCLITVPGVRAERHFITPLTLLPDDVAVFDPLFGGKRLSEYEQVLEIRVFRRLSAPVLSVIVPAYNCESCLSECMDSVLRQLPENCELIVVDDGSSDATRQILESWRGLRENVRILLREHKGASGARNAGLDEAAGEYVTFLDCDDCLQERFLEKALPLCAQGADLLIFGIERVFLTGQRECWTVPDRLYPTVSDFADEYIRTRAMLIYSNCNKFYRRSVIEALSLRFREGVSFGEDRLFNYRFLTGCGAVVTSKQIMLRYLQRSMESQSSKSIPQYFDRVLELHRAKTDAFLRLSRGTTEAERKSFCSRDLGNEIMQTVDRFALYPQEEEENLSKVNTLIFGRFPFLQERLTEYEAKNPDRWYQSRSARQLVIDCLRTFYEEERES